MIMSYRSTPAFRPLLLAGLIIIMAGCGSKESQPPTLAWYVFNESSGAFREAAEDCSQQSKDRYRIALVPLPADADQQREQLVRRLAAADSTIDIVGMDVIWTAEFAEAGWILPWPDQILPRIANGRLPPTTASVHYKDRLWAIPFTTNIQLLWYRKDRIGEAPRTWGKLIAEAEAINKPGTIQLQGQRYEGLTTFFVSLLASAGGSILDQSGALLLQEKPALETLSLLKRMSASPSVSTSLATDREEQTMLAYETGAPTFMVNYPFVWSSVHRNAPDVAQNTAYGRWPAVNENQASHVALGGLNLGVAAYGRHPELAFEAVECLTSAANQIKAAVAAGLPPTLDALYDLPEIRQRFPFADLLRETLRNAVLRPKTPVYNDISLAISRTLHPLRDIEPKRDLERLRGAIQRALDSEGLL
ncbi:MAG: ABC transporter substrate-binding protein [Methylomonas sp.]